MNRVVSRMAVGSPDGVRSTSYKIWTAKNHPDAYVVTRAAPFKATLHAARPGLDQEGHTKIGPAAGFATLGRYGHTAVKWRGQEVASAIWRQFLLYVPAMGLRRFREGVNDEPISWIPAPADEHQVVVEVDIGPDGLWQPNGAELLAESVLCDGRRLRVFFHVSPIPPAEEIQGLLAKVRPTAPDFKFGPGSRLLLFGQNEGAGTFIELAADMVPGR